MKKIIRAEIIAEIEVDTDWYGEVVSNETILELEKTNWQEWIVDHVIVEKLFITDK